MRTRLRLGAAAAVGLGALLLATVLASPALAWHSNVTVSARCLEGQVRVHYTVEAWEKQGHEATVDVSYKLNGEVTELQSKGMAYNEIAPAEQARMRAAVKPIYDKFTAEYQPDVVNLFKTELERVSKL